MMNHRKAKINPSIFLSQLLFIASLIGCAAQAAEQAELVPTLRQGVNLAGDFEVEPRGQWGTPIQAHFFNLAAQAGFDHVRVPIRWSAYTGPAPDFVIDDAFFTEVDWLLTQAKRVGLTIVINNHHFEALDSDPLAHKDELIAIWRQIGSRYANEPATTVFEINNEPAGVFNDQPELWNTIALEALNVIRQTNPTRLVILGPVEFNHPNFLYRLTLPDDDNLLVTIHSYDPIEFTVQGAPWFDPPKATGELWSPNQAEINYVWQDASWDSVVSRVGTGLRVQFERQYAAFGVRSLVPTDFSFDTAVVQADRPFDAIILCNVNESKITAELSQAKTISAGVYEMSAHIGACGPLSSIAIQLVSEQLVAPILSGFELCSSVVGCEKIIVPAAGALNIQMSAALAWAKAHDAELYLGEFGVYDHPDSPVDSQSRKYWIKAMRQAAENNGIGWAFFELSSEFGVYDHFNHAWRNDILDALFTDK